MRRTARVISYETEAAGPAWPCRDSGTLLAAWAGGVISYGTEDAVPGREFRDSPMLQEMWMIFYATEVGRLARWYMVHIRRQTSYPPPGFPAGHREGHGDLGD